MPSLSRMRVLVTGGAGFIGGGVVRALLARGHEVRVLDALLPVAHATREVPAGLDGAEVVLGDVRDPGVVDAALAGVDAVSHQAAMVGLGVDLADLPGYASCNDVGTAVLLAGMGRRRVRRLVLAGSMVVYGEGGYGCRGHGRVAVAARPEADLRAGRFEPRCPECAQELSPLLVGEDTPPDPRNGYAVTKLAQELLCRVWARETGGALTVLRYHNVYGPGMPRDTPYAGVAAIFRSALERGVPPRVFEDGGQRRDFVFVRDVAAANVAALEAGGSPAGSTAVTAATPVRVYNVGSGRPRTVGELAGALSTAMAGPPPTVTGEYRLGDVRHITADTTRLRAELGWQPVVSFEDGVREFAVAPLRG